MRLLCVLLPHFPLKCELARGRATTNPTVITTAVGSEKIVIDFFPEVPGLWCGMSPQQTLAVQGELEVVHADPRYYQMVFDSILDSLELKSPLAEGAELGVAYLGLAGLESIYATDDVLARAVRDAVPDLYDVRLGIGNNKFLSRMAAMSCPTGECRSLDGNPRDFLAKQPSDILPVSAKVKERLRDFGLFTLGHLQAMTASHLQAQFGPEGLLAWELSNGLDNTPLYPRMSEENIEESTALPSPTSSLDTLLMAWEAMITRALARLRVKNLGIRCISLWTKSWVGDYWKETVRFKEPAMALKPALNRVKCVIEDTSQMGPVEELGMSVTGTGRLVGRQKSLMAQVRAQEHLQEEVNQLEFRLGRPLLYQVKEVEPWSRIPERRYALIPSSR